MDTLKELMSLFRKPFMRRLLLLLLMCFVLFLVKGLITLLMLTFIFIYLINTAQAFVSRHLSRYIKINNSVIIVAIYLILLALLVLIVYFNAPKVAEQVINVVNTVTNFFLAGSKGSTQTNSVLLNELLGFMKTIDITTYVQDGRKYIIGVLTNIGALGLDFVMSLILSLFFMLEKKKIFRFLAKFKTSKLGWFYNDTKYFLVKFTSSFGKVIETQIVISFINSVLSLIILWILHFPNLLGLWAMILVLGLIPVAGVFISLLPLSVIAFNIGGLRYILYVLILVAILHSVESYVLNPKLMSNKTKLPVFVTFLVLIVSEHFFGVWGLIVGIPITIFLLDLLDVKMET
ncbi:MAG: AI-2E family transporter [Clostridia bacterium]|nr:AI-2E family transporter [Clostridia bacterium]MDR3645193.1 AI-2E family transporter [Clostridia bacterium]